MLALAFASGAAALQLQHTSVPPGRHATETLLDWFSGSGAKGEVSSAIAPGISAICGQGLVATRTLRLNELLLVAPLDTACMHAEAALADPDIGKNARQCVDHCGLTASVEALVTAALLAHARHSHDSEAARRWGPYVDSLPWGCGDETDPLKEHPIHVGDERLGPRVAQSRSAARAVRELLDGGVDEEICLRAIVLVASRAFNLQLRNFDGDSPPQDGRLRAVMCPVLDLANHPSFTLLGRSGAVGERFRTLKSPLHGVIRPKYNGDSRELKVYGPSHLEVSAGDELWAWYSHAGCYETTAEARRNGEQAFLAQYGFSPWD